MNVKLKVLKGGNTGKEVAVLGGTFVIGRADGCHLRAKSDAISRRHCELVIEGGNVLVRDLQSRNGTFVNGERIKDDCPVNSGDTIAVGPLQFELVVDHALGGAKRPKVKDVNEAAARVASAKSAVSEDDIFGWLQEGDDADREERLADPKTRQYTFTSKELKALQDAGEGEEEENGDKKKRKKEKKEPLKLPKAPDKTTENSQEAATEMLRKFFKRE